MKKSTNIIILKKIKFLLKDRNVLQRVKSFISFRQLHPLRCCFQNLHFNKTAGLSRSSVVSAFAGELFMYTVTDVTLPAQNNKIQ